MKYLENYKEDWKQFKRNIVKVNRNSGKNVKNLRFHRNTSTITPLSIQFFDTSASNGCVPN